MECVTCGKPAEGLLVDDVKNLAKGGTPYCKACVEEQQQDDDLCHKRILAFDPEKVSKMINPDIGCDFCFTPDPLYQWEMPELSYNGFNFGTRWVGCAECGPLADGKDFVSTALRAPVPKPAFPKIVRLHMLVMMRITNKAYYVRREDDGRVSLG